MFYVKCPPLITPSSLLLGAMLDHLTPEQRIGIAVEEPRKWKDDERDKGLDRRAGPPSAGTAARHGGEHTA
jgi:hypothetical protein